MGHGSSVICICMNKGEAGSSSNVRWFACRAWVRAAGLVAGTAAGGAARTEGAQGAGWACARLPTLAAAGKRARAEQAPRARTGLQRPQTQVARQH
jgi:hypothetical protein